MVRICATEKGRRANDDHDRFHRQMIDQVLNILTPEETVVFLRALDSLAHFFRAGHGAQTTTQPI